MPDSSAFQKICCVVTADKGAAAGAASCGADAAYASSVRQVLQKQMTLVLIMKSEMAAVPLMFPATLASPDEDCVLTENVPQCTMSAVDLIESVAPADSSQMVPATTPVAADCIEAMGHVPLPPFPKRPYKLSVMQQLYNKFGIKMPAEISVFPPGLDVFAALAATCILSGQPAAVGQRYVFPPILGLFIQAIIAAPPPSPTAMHP